MMAASIQALLQNAQAQLMSVTEVPALEAALLLAHVLQVPRTYLYAHPEEIVPAAKAAALTHYLERRSHREPLAYLLGSKEFWSMSLRVTPDTLIPRPETELLIETICERFGDTTEQKHVADLGTGSGAIALALAKERPHWQIYATDVSETTLSVARNNAQEFGLSNISFWLGSWCTALPLVAMDIIVSNPPYLSEEEWAVYGEGLAFEPRQALVSGQDGLAAIREIVQTAPKYLKPGGYLFVEHGFQQAQAVQALLRANSFQDVVSYDDYFGKTRITVGCYQGS